MTTRILLVDDSPTIREIVKLFLSGQPFEFHEAGTATAALAMLDRQGVDLVIADQKMPGMDGLSFVKKVRMDARAAVRRIPIILLSTEALALMASGATGVDQFIQKPVTPAALLAAVHRALGAVAA